MSLSTLFTILVLVGAYQLGAHNTRHPGDLAGRIVSGWQWLWQKYQ